MNKIYTIEELALMRTSGQLHALAAYPAFQLVHAHGCFDLLHIGHIKHLEEARRLGDILVVTITPDIYVNKGPGRPLFNENLRAEAIAALSCVDYVAINKWPTAVEAIKHIKPDIFIKGSEFRNNPTPAIIEEEEAVNSIGGKLVFTGGNVISSSSELMKRVTAC